MYLRFVTNRKSRNRPGKLEYYYYYYYVCERERSVRLEIHRLRRFCTIKCVSAVAASMEITYLQYDVWARMA